MNNQKPVPPKKTDGNTLLVHSVFATVQGEGPFAGVPAIFVRLADCNLQCPLCDTEYTEGAEEMTVPDLMARLCGTWSEGRAADLVVITGGEPFRQNLYIFISALVACLFKVQIETNGMLTPQEPKALASLAETDFLTVVVSPKTGTISPWMHSNAAAFKYVVSACDVHDDLLPKRALGHPLGKAACVARPDPLTFVGDVYVQPADAKDPQTNAENMAAAVNAVTAVRGRKLCLQMHKYAGLD